jgi:hypothetical protein
MRRRGLNGLSIPLFALAAALLAGGPALAGPMGGTAEKPETKEVPELATDRPDFTETSIVVPRGSLQIESGFTWEKGPNGVESFNAPELLLRWGLLEKTELRLAPPEYFRIRGGGQRISGFGETYLGLKQQLGPYRGWDFAVIPAVNLPTGSGALNSGHVDPEFVLTWSRELNDKYSLGGIFGFFWPTEEGDRNFTWAATVSLARSLGNRWGTFLEYAGAFPESGGDVHLIHHGYTYKLSRLRQLDLHFGFGLSREAPDFFIGMGYAVRF